jgi:hypothetical protein
MGDIFDVWPLFGLELKHVRRIEDCREIGKRGQAWRVRGCVGDGSFDAGCDGVWLGTVCVNERGA